MDSGPPHPLRYFVVDAEPLRVGCLVETESNRVELVTCWRDRDVEFPSKVVRGLELTFERRDGQIGWWSVTSEEVEPTFKRLKVNTSTDWLPVFYLSALRPKPYYYPPRGPPKVPGGTPLCTAIGDLWGIVDDQGVRNQVSP